MKSKKRQVIYHDRRKTGLRLFAASAGAGNFSHQQKFLVAGLQGWPLSQAHKTWAKNNCLAKIGHRILGGKAVKKSGGRPTNYRRVKHFHSGQTHYSLPRPAISVFEPGLFF